MGLPAISGIPPGVVVVDMLVQFLGDLDRLARGPALPLHRRERIHLSLQRDAVSWMHSANECNAAPTRYSSTWRYTQITLDGCRTGVGHR